MTSSVPRASRDRWRRAWRGPRVLWYPATAVTVVLAALSGACGKGGPPRAPTPVTAGGRAAPGDTLYVIEYFIRPDRGAQFERFLTETYWPAMRRVALTDTNTRRALQQTRVIYPTRPDEGTLRYMFLMDPVVRGALYDVYELLVRVYSPQEAERQYRQFRELWARDFARRVYVQPLYPS